MFDLRHLSKTEDCHIQREMGSRSMDEYLSHAMLVAANPDQMEALAFQCLCMARRIKHHALGESSRKWKDYWRAINAQAELARARITTNPSRTTMPGLFNHRSVGKPGCLDSDLYLPHFFRLDMSDDFDGADTVYAGTYEAALRHDAVYRVCGSRLGDTWVEAVDTRHSSKIPSRKLRRLQDLGRLVAVRQPAAAAKAA